MKSKKASILTPGRVIISSIFLMILIGTLLLALPIARTTDISPIDLFFTATSATCVTGLFTIPLSKFTTFGHAVIMMLVQIGGLGLVTLTLFLFSLFTNLGIATQMMIGEVLDLESWAQAKKMLLFIVWLTLTVEAIGAAVIFWQIHADYTTGYGIFLSWFHAISSFCNAGISLLDTHAQQFHTHIPLMIISGTLMFMGSFGFITWEEISKHIMSWREKGHHPFSLHSKTVMYTTAVLLTLFALLFFFLEFNHSMQNMTWTESIVNGLFNAIACRSTGFLTSDVGTFHIATLFLMIIFAFIGAAPNSTGSGIRLTSLAIFLAALKATITQKSEVTLLERTINSDQVHKAIAIVTLSLSWVIFCTFILLISENNWDFFSIMFEAVSAFSNLGVTMGVTPTLSFMGKIIVILSMIGGRIGSLTLIMALRRRKEIIGYTYPKERVMLS